MKYEMTVYEFAFDAILSGQKRIEIRTNNSYEDIDYSKFKAGDTIELTSLPVSPGKKLRATIKDVRHYESLQSLFEKETVERALSGRGHNIETAIEWIYDNIKEYKDNIPKHGVYAIELEDVAHM